MSDWNTTTVGDCIVQVPFPAKVPRQQFLQNGAFPIISQEADFINGYWDQESDVLQVVEPVVVFGDHTQVLKYVDFDFVVGADGVKVLKPIPEIDPKFFYYQLMAKELPTLGYARHFRLLREQEIAFPDDIGEQQRIVTKLDAAFGALREAEGHVERNRANARELFESYLNGVFEGKGDGWAEKSLQDICDVRDGTHDSPKYHDTGFALVTSKNLKPDGLDLENVSLISEEDFNEINRRSKVDKGDVLFAMIGTIGNPTVINDEPSFAIKNVALFKCGSALDGRFLRYALLTSDVKVRMRKEAKGTTQRFVGLGYLRSFRIAVPTLIEQHRIVTELDALNEKTKELEATYQRKLRELEGLKKGLLGAAFRGEL